MDSLLKGLWRSARRVASALLAGLTRHKTPEELEARIAALAPRDQASVVLATLAGLFALSLLFAQAGLVGMLGFLLLVILVVN